MLGLPVADTENMVCIQSLNLAAKTFEAGYKSEAVKLHTHTPLCGGSSRKECVQIDRFIVKGSGRLSRHKPGKGRAHICSAAGILSYRGELVLPIKES